MCITTRDTPWSSLYKVIKQYTLPGATLILTNPYLIQGKLLLSSTSLSTASATSIASINGSAALLLLLLPPTAVVGALLPLLGGTFSTASRAASW